MVERASRGQLDDATAQLDPPFAVLDRAALQFNAEDLERRAAGKQIRLASKSIRCREMLRDVLARPGFSGILGYTVAEALWLAEEFDDIVVGYPSVERAALQQLATSENVGRITLMVDRAEQLDFIDAAVSPGKRATLRLCIDLDASLRLFGGRVHIGARRSATHEPQDAADSHESSNDAPGSSWWA